MRSVNTNVYRVRNKQIGALNIDIVEKAYATRIPTPRLLIVANRSRCLALILI